MVRSLAKIASILIIFILAIYAIRPTVSVELNNIRYQDRNAYSASVPFWVTIFAAPENQKSFYNDGVLFENNKPIGRGGALHADISENGKGRWSYWGRDIYLSSTLGSSVEPSEQNYRLVVSFDPPLYLILATVTPLALCIILYLLIKTRELNANNSNRVAACKNWKIKNLRYSPEIDGIRALAVILVMFYHFDLSYLKGGFVGVDVFFVISGYLITKIICIELSAGKFSFKNFYFRRARRIFPALAAVSLLTTLLATIITPPDTYKNFGGSLLSSSLFFSNIYFYLQSGYFDSDAITKPLLHTWSLGVEEHFYIFFPLFLFFIGRSLTHFKAALAILALALSSLIAAELVLIWSRDAAFFISPLRFFEFAIGALLVFINTDYSNKINKDRIAFIGILLILLPGIFYTHEMHFPGVAALPICIGTALLIYFRDAPAASKILGSRAFVGVGKISYSAYLVHWPIVVFYKALRTSQLPLSPLEISALFLATFFIANLVYRHIETPFRHIGYLEQRGRIKVGLTAFCTLLLPLVVTGVLIYSSSGFPQRFSIDTQQLLKTPIEQHHLYVWDRFNALEGKEFKNNDKRRTLIIGDSQAADLLNIIEETIPGELDISTFLIPESCQAVIPENSKFYDSILTDTTQRNECRERQDSILKDKRVASADNIVIASSWMDYGIDQIPHTIHTLTTLNPTAKIIITPSKTQGRGAIDVIFLSRWTDKTLEKISFESRTPTLESKRAQLISVTREADFFDIGKHICNWSSKTCSVLSDNGEPIFSDITHLTKSGAVFLGEKIQKKGEFEVFR